MSASINPLPADEVGPRLLVRLQAEKVMTKAGLKEAWEGEDGWRFGDLCAVVACVIDDTIVAPAEYKAAGRMLARHSEQFPKIIAVASPPLLYERMNSKTGMFEEKAIGEAVEGVLILGLGTPGFPFELSAKAPAHVAAESVLAKLLGVEESKIPGRCFERARKKVEERYGTHCAKMTEREERGCGGHFLPEVKDAHIRLELMTKFGVKLLEKRDWPFQLGS